MSESMKKAIKIFRRHGGVLQTGEAINKGIHPRTLYAMRDEGTIERLCRGTYRLADLPPLTNPDFATVAAKIPKGVICLISALSFHEITTEIPHEIHVATLRDTKYPRLDYPPIRIFRFSRNAYTEGIETHTIDGMKVRIYSPEKTIADAFKYRNKIGQDVPVEALKLYWAKKKPDIHSLLHYASICRVSNVIQPYIETLT
jgi:predicted transcriptional regulator of viral defense system